VAFFVVALIAGMFIASAGAVGAVVVAALALMTAVALVRGSDARTRAVLARLAVGFALGAVLFGGCLVLISNADFR
jgi:hypothetical protein